MISDHFHNLSRRRVISRFLRESLCWLPVLVVIVFLSFPQGIGQFAWALNVLGLSSAVVAGLVVALILRSGRLEHLVEGLSVPLRLAPHKGLFELHARFLRAMADLAEQSNPLLQEFALVKLASLQEDVRSLADGKVVFVGSEAWRTVYEKLLQTEGIRRYHSVAWVKNGAYWQDHPGRQSTRLNRELVERGMHIERVVILRSDLWAGGDSLPSVEIRSWLLEQNRDGVKIYLVHEDQVRHEPQLLLDFGIYGDRAVGIHETDEQGRTLRFTLQFDPVSHRQAMARWETLLLFAVALDDLLDRARITSVG